MNTINGTIQTVQEEKTAAVTTEVETEKPEMTQQTAQARPAYDVNIPKTLGRVLDDGNDLVFAEMPRKIQDAELDAMKRAIRNKQIKYCKVSGVENGVDKNTVIIAAKSGTLRVVFEAPDFFAYSGMKDIDLETEENKTIRYRRKASRMLGAVVSFIPMALGETDDGIPFVVASRKASMEALQEQHFFAENADAAPGVVAKASIVSTGPRYVTVECLGVETTLGTGALSAFEYIEDASQKFHVGDGLYVAVQEMDIDKEKRVINTLRLSHSLVERLSASVEKVNQNMRGNRYLSTVVAVTNSYYIVVIDGFKIRGLVPLTDYIGEEKLAVGDKVSMLVKNVAEDKNMVIGACRKTV